VAECMVMRCEAETRLRLESWFLEGRGEEFR
jgi:hypothetical protein